MLIKFLGFWKFWPLAGFTWIFPRSPRSFSSIQNQKISLTFSMQLFHLHLFAVIKKKHVMLETQLELFEHAIHFNWGISAYRLRLSKLLERKNETFLEWHKLFMNWYETFKFNRKKTTYKYDQLRANLCVKCRIISQFVPFVKVGVWLKCIKKKMFQSHRSPILYAR